MNRQWFGMVGLAVASTLLLNVSSCARSQQLISIQVTPNPVVFEGIGAQVQFTALGTFIHPPETKDITNQVQWRIDISFLATIDPTGLATATSTCGAGNAIASVYSDPTNPSSGSVVVGMAAISGVDQGSNTCQH